MKEKVKIIVGVHNSAKVYADGVYMPLHLGKSISKYSLNLEGDDTGDNISNKNPYYCELTAQYWAWKNLDVEYIGLSHYRRYFKTKIETENINTILKNHDVLLVEPIYYNYPLIQKLNFALTLEDVAIFINVIISLYPDYKTTIIDYLYNNNKDIAFNMFVSKKKVFDEFAEWQFKILSECEKQFRLSPYTRLKRIYGYLGEYLLPIYFIHNKYRIKFDKVVPFIGENKVKSQSLFNKLTAELKFRLCYRNKTNNVTFLDAVIVGLKNDNIEVKNIF